MKLPTSVFFGVPPAAERNHVVDFVKQNKFKTAVIPCAGRFAIAEAMAEAGIKPQNIICGDISLYSSIIGYYLSGQDLSTLNIRTEYDFVDLSAEPVDIVASLIYAMMLTKSKDTNYYVAELRHAIEIDRDLHIANIKERLEKLYSKIGGLQYNIIDMCQLLSQHTDDEKAFLFVDPPALGTKDYPKMFDFGGAITWDEPSITQFGSDEDMVRLFRALAHTKATSMILKFRKKTGATDDWHIYHISVDSKMERKYLFLNRKTGVSYIDRPRITGTEPLDLPIITKDDVITEDSTLTVMPVDRDVAWYYRDLFTHKFGVGSADENFLILVDGKITSVRGYAPIGLSGGGDLHEIYGIVYNNTRYRHLGRLIMRLVTSQEFADAVNTSIYPITGITTTTYKKFKVEREVTGFGFEEYESKEIKGKGGPGRWKLKHRAPIVPRTFKEFLSDWLREEENYGNQQRKRKRTRASRQPGTN